MKYKKLSILLLIFYSVDSYAVIKSSGNEPELILRSTEGKISTSRRIVEDSVNKDNNSHYDNTPSVYIPNKPHFYELDNLKSNDNMVSHLFEEKQTVYLHHTFRGPNINLNINTIQNINNGNDINVIAKGKFNSSISGSYLYNLSPRFRVGPEIMHTTYDNKSNITINDSFSLMVRSEFVLYKNKTFELYSVAGTGLSFNTLNLLYTRLTISNNTSTSDSYKEYIVKPIINGSSVPHKTAYFYCSTYPRFNNLNINVITDPADKMKGISEFTGDGFGICIYQNVDATKNTTIKYQEFLVPEKATSIPWFFGIGLDYNLNSVINKLINFTFIDNEIGSNTEIGVSLGVRYFNNGTSTVKYKTVKSVDQYTIKYKGYLSLNISLFLKL